MPDVEGAQSTGPEDVEIGTPHEEPDPDVGGGQGGGGEDPSLEPELLLNEHTVEQVVNFSWTVGSLLTREPWELVTPGEREGMIPLLTDDLNSDEAVRKLLSKMDGKMGYTLYAVATWSRLGPIIARRRADAARAAAR